MRLVDLVLSLFGKKSLVGLADKVAYFNQGDVWERVRERAPLMSAHEASGYIRVHSRAVIETYVKDVLASRGELDARVRTRLIETATVRLTRRLTRRAKSTAAQAQPVRQAA